ncbi:MAG TPA: UbiD family decarboxylase, partial [Phycisphaeraceae bacterium]|nr:UbiD family decarboxylase [Phycisphaeraceae bacterium]
MYQTLQEFIEHLREQGELHVVASPVNPVLEISAVTDRVSKSSCPKKSNDAERFDPLHCNQGGKALLFEKVQGCDFPLAINLFGSYSRMEIALNCENKGGLTGLANRIDDLAELSPPKSWRDAAGMLKRYVPLLRIGPRRRRHGLCQEVVKLTERGEVDLTRLPLIKCWPLDGDPEAVGSGMTAEQAGTAGGEGRYITFAGMHTIHADDRNSDRPHSHNIGMYRAQLIDKTHLAMHWHIHHDGAAHWRSWKKIGEKMPIAICFGGESVLPYAATAPLPPGISELLMAGFLNGRGIPMVRGKTVPLFVPANSEIVIEGYVSTSCGGIGFDPRSGEELGEGAVFEGPFGDHTGFYSLPDRYPVVEVTAITHRRNAVFPATIVGPPPQEDYYMGKATERIFLPLLRKIIPDLADYDLPMFGCFHNCAFLQIHKEYPLQGRKVMFSVWGAGQMAWTKIIIVVDDDVPVHNHREVFATIFRNCDFSSDVETVQGPLDILDHAAPSLGTGGKLGIDATRKLENEGTNNDNREINNRPLSDTFIDDLIGEAGIHDAEMPDYSNGRALFIAVDPQPGAGMAAVEHVLK